MAIVALAWLPLVLGGTFIPKKASLLSFDAAGAKNRPVAKVLTLLRKMSQQLEREADEDEELYTKMKCWCQENSKEKSTQLEMANNRIDTDRATVEELTRNGAVLSTQKKAAAKELAEALKSLHNAVALRKKQQKEFTQNEKDMLVSIKNLKAAIVVLTSQQSMLQMPKMHIRRVARTLQHVLASKNAKLLNDVLDPWHMDTIARFIESPEHYFNIAPAFLQSHTPSGQLVGMLKEMQNTFDNGLSAAQKKEAENDMDFANLENSQSSQIKSGKALIDKRTQQLAKSDSKKAVTKQDRIDTTAARNADKKFLRQLEERCELMEKEYEERRKTRQLEMTAVGKAISILGSDDARDLFSKTHNPSFLQTKTAEISYRRKHVGSLLKSLAMKHNRPGIAAIAMKVQLDAFSKVKKAIKAMMAQLLKEGEDEIKHKDFCTDEFHKNNLQTERKTHSKDEVIVTIEDLEQTVKETTEDIKALQDDVAELRLQIKRAGEDREKENMEFQTTVRDQRATQELVSKAIDVLKSVYVKETVSLAQTASKTNAFAGNAEPPPAPEFKTFKQNSSGGGVTRMLEQIVADAKAMEAEAVHDEEEGQRTYEELVKDTNASLDSKSKEIVNRSKTKAKSEVALVEAIKDRKNLMIELKQLADYKAELHSNCDYVVKNFEGRQKARAEEINGLKQATAILSGSTSAGFLQKIPQA